MGYLLVALLLIIGDVVEISNIEHILSQVFDLSFQNLDHFLLLPDDFFVVEAFSGFFGGFNAHDLT